MLKENVRDYIRTSKAKNKGHRTVKPFMVTIIDLSLGGADGNSAAKVHFCVNIRLQC